MPHHKKVGHYHFLKALKKRKTHHFPRASFERGNNNPHLQTSVNKTKDFQIYLDNRKNLLIFASVLEMVLNHNLLKQ